MNQQQLQIDGIEVKVEGEGAETIVMIHGWPNTWRMWDAQVAALKAEYRCVRFSLPGFERSGPMRAYSLEETLRIFKTIIEKTSPGQKVVLMLHDWGCILGYQFYMRHPELVSRIVGVDIGDSSSGTYLRSLTAGQKLLIVGYQLWLILAWKFGGGLGTRMTKWMARMLKAKTDFDEVHAGMNYPYNIYWFGGKDSYTKAPRFANDCPMFYLYGTQKPFPFHSKKWAEELAAKPGCRVLEMQTDHWVMLGKPEEFNQAVLGWLKETAPA